MNFLALFTLLSSLLFAGYGWAGELESPIDVRYVSQLCGKLHSLERPERCNKFWTGINEELEDTNNLDIVELVKLSQFLKSRPTFTELVDFVDDCVQFLSGKYKYRSSIKTVGENCNEKSSYLSHNIDELERKLSKKEQELVSEQSRNAAIPALIDQLMREKDDVIRKFDDYKLRWINASKRAKTNAEQLSHLVKEKEEASKRAKLDLDRAKEMQAQMTKERDDATRRAENLKLELDTKEGLAKTNSALQNQVNQLSGENKELKVKVERQRVEQDKKRPPLQQKDKKGRSKKRWTLPKVKIQVVG